MLTKLANENICYVMYMAAMQRWLIVIGGICIALGVTYPLWSRLIYGLWDLPGNIVIKKGHFQLYFPLTLCLIASLLFTLISWLLKVIGTISK